MKNSRRNFFKNSALGAAGVALGVHTLKYSRVESILDGNTRPDFEKMNIDLLKDESQWSTFSPRKEITPSFTKKSKDTDNNRLVLTINGGNNPDSVGCWLRKLPLLHKGHRYRIETSFIINQVENRNTNIRAIITKNRSEYVEFSAFKEGDNWIQLSAEFTPENNENNL